MQRKVVSRKIDKIEEIHETNTHEITNATEHQIDQVGGVFRERQVLCYINLSPPLILMSFLLPILVVIASEWLWCV